MAKVCSGTLHVVTPWLPAMLIKQVKKLGKPRRLVRRQSSVITRICQVSSSLSQWRQKHWGLGAKWASNSWKILASESSKLLGKKGLLATSSKPSAWQSKGAMWPQSKVQFLMLTKKNSTRSLTYNYCVESSEFLFWLIWNKYWYSASEFTIF